MKQILLRRRRGGNFFAVAALILILCAVAEVFLWNNHLYFAVRREKEQVLALENAVYSDGVRWEDGALIVPAGTEAVIEFWDCTVQSVAVTLKTDAESSGMKRFSVTGTVAIADDANRSHYQTVQEFRIVPDGEQNERTVRCESAGALRKLKLVLDAAKSEYRIMGVELNSRSVPFSFSVLRFAGCSMLFLLIAAAKMLGWTRQVYDPENPVHNRALCCVMLLCMGFVLVISVNVAIIHRDNIYAQLLKAMLDGRLYLAEGDPALELLEDVYDFSLREESGIPYLWDRAYYEGKYYCYFGLAPLLLYGIIYGVSGQIAPDTLVMALLNLLFLLMLFPALRELVRVLKRKVNLPLMLTVSMAAAFGTFLFALQGMPSFYTMPPTCAAVGSVGMILASYRAENVQGKEKRRLLYAAAGVAFVFVLASRPNVCLVPLAFCLPLYVRVLWDKTRKKRSRFCDAAAFAVPVVLGLCVLLGYNFMRFGSLWQFGSWYQLTAYNTAYYELKWDLHSFLLAIYHYFFQMPGISWQFPFFEFTAVGNGMEGCYKYFNVDYAGVFAMPLNWALVLAFRSFRRNPHGLEDGVERIKRWVMRSALVSVMFLAFFDYCMAGINLRYVVDISVGVMLLSVLLVFDLAERIRPGTLRFGIVCALCVLTVLAGTMFVFQNADSAWLAMNPDSYLEASDFFMGILE